MKVAFLKGTSIIDKVIKVWTFSKYSHCELVFSDGISFGSSLRSPFRTEVAQKTYDPKYWDLIEIQMLPYNEQRIRDFCMTQVGKEYDWTAIFFSMILPFQQHRSEKWICSEICVAAFQEVGYFSNIKPCTVSPGKFFKMVKNII